MFEVCLGCRELLRLQCQNYLLFSFHFLTPAWYFSSLSSSLVKSQFSMATQNGSFCLFLGDLSLFCAEKDILSAFSVFGRVTNVRIKRSSENKKHLLYGFVEYSTAAEAVHAMQSMNGAMFLGRVLRSVLRAFPNPYDWLSLLTVLKCWCCILRIIEFVGLQTSSRRCPAEMR